ncbi:MAG: heme/hemin ABC transporter substrate-binding protein [Solitalea-like symbiont of Acarus siro]
MQQVLTQNQLLKEKTKIGHRQNISIEGILSLSPNVVLALENELSQNALQQLKNAKVKVMLFKQTFSVDNTKQLINDIAHSFNRDKEAKNIIAKLDNDLSNAKKYIGNNKIIKILFIYARGTGTLLVAGKITQVDKMITLAGATNAINSFDNFNPLTPESLISANPDVILLFDSGLKSLGGELGLLKVQGIMQTKAGKNKKFIEMDGQLLTGFGPRLGQAIQELAKHIN